MATLPFKVLIPLLLLQFSRLFAGFVGPYPARPTASVFIQLRPSKTIQGSSKTKVGKYNWMDFERAGFSIMAARWSQDVLWLTGISRLPGNHVIIAHYVVVGCGKSITLYEL